MQAPCRKLAQTAQGDHGAQHQQLIRHRVDKLPEGGDDMLPPGNLPIQKIGKGGDAKDDQRRDAGSLTGQVQKQHTHRHQTDAQQRQPVRDIEVLHGHPSSLMRSARRS